ncbi:hypothetical protein OG806_48105 [Streptomyces sp. NBC_00882]|nr:hypothetical protein OG806_48105 [Streptomyces sp. NBC_00882]WSZ63550.1 hypothetical protein OH824_46940 [Streptomyces canus]
MGVTAPSWTIVPVGALVAAVSAVRVVTTRGEARFAGAATC